MLSWNEEVFRRVQLEDCQNLVHRTSFCRSDPDTTGDDASVTSRAFREISCPCWGNLPGPPYALTDEKGFRRSSGGGGRGAPWLLRNTCCFAEGSLPGRSPETPARFQLFPAIPMEAGYAMDSERAGHGCRGSRLGLGAARGGWSARRHPCVRYQASGPRPHYRAERIVSAVGDASYVERGGPPGSAGARGAAGTSGASHSYSDSNSTGTRRAAGARWPGWPRGTARPARTAGCGRSGWAAGAEGRPGSGWRHVSGYVVR